MVPKINDEMRKRYIADVSKIANRLGELNIGDSISYIELSELIGIAIQSGKEGYRALCAARKKLRKSGKEFYTIQGVGIRRATREDSLLMMSTNVHGIKRKATNGNRIYNNVCEIEKSTPNERALMAACNTTFVIVSHLTKPNRQKELVLLYNNKPELLLEEAARQTLESFK